MTRWPALALAIALSALLLGGCGSAGAATVHRGSALPVAPGELTAQDVAAAQTTFGLDLLHAVCARAPGENVLLSPTSAAEALSLLQPAARGQTAEALRRLLHLPEWSPDLVAALREHTRALDGLRYDGDLDDDLDDDDAPDALQMSNRLWTALGLNPERDYLDAIATAFDADVRALDFAGDPSGATDEINRTVEDDTRGIIEKLFDDPLPSTTRAVLTNALHLKARWAEPFVDTQPAPFAAPGGEVTVDMMSGATGGGRTAEGWVSVELPYRDGTLSAIAVLPPEGNGPCDVDPGTLAALRGGPAGNVAIALPRLHIEQSHDLLRDLIDLGLPADGDYSGLGAGLGIARVVQTAYLDVDEQGTEAAAATGIAMETSAPVTTGSVVFDRPFLLLLTDTATQSPLFVTVVQDPSAR